MDAVSSLLCLALGSALPLLGIWMLVRRGWRQLEVAGAYGEVSRRLGLDVDTRGVSLQGHLGEQRIWVGEVMVGHGPDRRMACWGVLDLERPLGLGLMMRRRGLSERLFRRPRGKVLTIGDDELDRLLELHADEPERARLLLDEPVRELLRSTLRRWRDLVVTDQSVRVYLKQPLAHAEDLQELVDGMRTLASALSRARRAVPPPPPLSMRVEGWSTLATELGIQLEAAFPGIAGEIDGRPFRITPVRTSDGYAAELRLGFQQHRRTGLRVRTQVEPDGYWSVGQDIQVGDPDFDRSFVVKGYDPELVRERLGPAREALLRLHAAGRLDVDDLRLYVGNLPPEPERLLPVVQTAVTAAQALGW